jgi:hypothetical protein
MAGLLALLLLLLLMLMFTVSFGFDEFVVDWHDRFTELLFKI